MSQRYSRLANNARHESATFDELRSKHDSYENPLGWYIQTDEQPEAICRLKKCTIKGIDDTSWKLSAGILDSGHAVITDKRIIALFPKDDEPQITDIHFTDTVSVTESSGLRSDKLIIEDLEGYRYKLALDVDQEIFETVTEIIRDLNKSVDSEYSSAVKFLDKIDGEIAAAGDAESALHAIAQLFEDRSETTHFDQAVAESNSIEELGQRMATLPNFGNSQSEISQSKSTTSRLKSEGGVANLRQRITATARGADPKDVGKYSLGAILGFGTAAISAPISTTVGITALLAGGAATGAYASAHPDSIAARIEPIPLGMNVKARSSQLGSSSGVGGYGTGAALGLAEHLGQMDHDELDEAYARWLTEIDIESVREGQRAATRYARQSDAFDDPRQASILGGAAGLAYGYADLDEEVDPTGKEDAVGELIEEAEDSGS